MLYGSNPFARPTQKETHNAIMKIEYSFPGVYNVSHDAQEFVRGLLRLQPSSSVHGGAAVVVGAGLTA